ncbi:hypothetical protein ASPACDRAFT_120321 [Aspergillus aculeatus ATCC 16872]|uniref:Tat pathway signal sequence n=1 Tax=Aspergillus aculeatus (strain ATCC 16872 / CBS 172.66 / WB 5094) TaxID=690307 RepID=A0A1L9WSN2_ASPA1|nr:uncharacterized protein ASPACDRAFT_120321 [Aspergillus aculeatus ATCC 16872]OJJ99190.1 hypothetical protein ASPACDRAFT_120321 [Aspergillus aculeatus ATCC 16872]
MKDNRQGYERMINTDENDDTDFADNTVYISRFGSRCLQVTWSLVCLLMFLAGVVMLSTAQSWKLSDRECAAQLSIWSPLLEAVEFEQRDWVSIFATQNSGYTGAPTEQMEARWKRLVDVPSVVVPPERLPLLNRSTEQGFVPVSAESPIQGYVAGVEVFHHLHCLNVLRQYIGRDEYPEGRLPRILKQNSPLAIRAHVDHCIETIRLALMCNADVTPYLLYEKGGESPSQVPAREDFQAFHKCKRFDRLLDWVRLNGVVVPLHPKGSAA